MEYKTYHRVENVSSDDITHVAEIIKGIAGILSTCIFSNKSKGTCSISVNCTKTQWNNINSRLGLAKNPNQSRFGYYLSKDYEA